MQAAGSIQNPYKPLESSPSPKKEKKSKKEKPKDSKVSTTFDSNIKIISSDKKKSKVENSVVLNANYDPRISVTFDSSIRNPIKKSGSVTNTNPKTEGNLKKSFSQLNLQGSIQNPLVYDTDIIILRNVSKLFKKTKDELLVEFESYQKNLENLSKQKESKASEIDFLLKTIYRFVKSKEVDSNNDKFFTCFPVIQKICLIPELQENDTVKKILKKSLDKVVQLPSNYETLHLTQQQKDMQIVTTMVSQPFDKLKLELGSLKLTIEGHLKQGQDRISNILDILRILDLLVDVDTSILALRKFLVLSRIILEIYKLPGLVGLGIDTQKAFNKLTKKVNDYVNQQLLEENYASQVIDAVLDPKEVESHFSKTINDLVKELKESEKLSQSERLSKKKEIDAEKKLIRRRILAGHLAYTKYDTMLKVMCSRLLSPKATEKDKVKLVLLAAELIRIFDFKSRNPNPSNPFTLNKPLIDKLIDNIKSLLDKNKFEESISKQLKKDFIYLNELYNDELWITHNNTPNGNPEKVNLLSMQYHGLNLEKADKKFMDYIKNPADLDDTFSDCFKHLLLMGFEYFHNVDIMELTNPKFEKMDPMISTYKHLVIHFNKLSEFVKNFILPDDIDDIKPDTEEGKKAIEKQAKLAKLKFEYILNLAYKYYQSNDFLTCFALYSPLNNAPILRLWGSADLNDQSKRLFKLDEGLLNTNRDKLETLNSLFNPDANSKNFYTHIETVSKPKGNTYTFPMNYIVSALTFSQEIPTNAGQATPINPQIFYVAGKTYLLLVDAQKRIANYNVTNGKFGTFSDMRGLLDKPPQTDNTYWNRSNIIFPRNSQT